MGWPGQAWLRCACQCPHRKRLLRNCTPLYQPRLVDRLQHYNVCGISRIYDVVSDIDRLHYLEAFAASSYAEGSFQLRTSGSTYQRTINCVSLTRAGFLVLPSNATSGPCFYELGHRDMGRCTRYCRGVLCYEGQA